MNKENPTYEEVKEWVERHIPLGVKPKSKFAKTDFISPYSSAHAQDEVVNGLAEALHKELSNGWVSVNDRLPNHLETVWISNGKSWTTLGLLVCYEDGCCWAESNGVVYQEGGNIVAECEEDDLDVQFWHPLPKAITK